MIEIPATWVRMLRSTAASMGSAQFGGTIDIDPDNKISHSLIAGDYVLSELFVEFDTIAITQDILNSASDIFLRYSLDDHLESSGVNGSLEGFSFHPGTAADTWSPGAPIWQQSHDFIPLITFGSDTLGEHATWVPGEHTVPLDFGSVNPEDWTQFMLANTLYNLAESDPFFWPVDEQFFEAVGPFVLLIDVEIEEEGWGIIT